MNTLKPHLEETTYKSFFKYTIPKTILKRLPTINIGKLNAVPEIVMSSTIYNLFRKVLIQNIKELKSLRIFLSFELLLNKPDGTEIVWKKNLGRIDVGSMADFWHQLSKYFTEYIEEMKRREYEVPAQFLKIDLHIYKFNPLNGGSSVELPREISGTKGVVNVKNMTICVFYTAFQL